jgi:PhnB protein
VEEVTMAVKAIPEGYHSFTPYFVVDGATEFITFLKNAFGAEEIMRMPAHGGKLGHAELRVGDSVLMLADMHPPEHPARQLNGLLYVTDCDGLWRRAVAAGAKGVREPENQFYGDRMAAVVDSWGNYWSIATHIEDVSPEEMKRRMEALKPA